MSSIYFGFIRGHPWMIKSRITIIHRKDLRGMKKKGTITNVFRKKGESQHKSINMFFPSPKIEAYFVMLPWGTPFTT
jgi:hypothetical protein